MKIHVRFRSRIAITPIQPVQSGRVGPATPLLPPPRASPPTRDSRGLVVAELNEPLTPESLVSWVQEVTRERLALETQFASPIETDRARAFDSMEELLLEAIKAV